MADHELIVAKKVFLERGQMFGDESSSHQFILTDEYEMLNSLVFVERFIRSLKSNAKQAFTLQGNHSIGTKVVASSKIMEAVALLKRNEEAVVQMHFPFHSFSPYWYLFWNSAQSLLPKLRMLNAYSEEDKKSIVDQLNRWLGELYEKSRALDFQRKADDFKRGSRENRRELVRYVKSMSRKVGRLGLVRVDLGYQNASYSGRGGYEAGVRLEGFLRDRKSIIGFVQKQILSGAIFGYAWQVSYSIRRGYVLQFLLLLPDKSPGCIGDEVGKHWKYCVAFGPGDYRIRAIFPNSSSMFYNVTEMNAQIEMAADAMTLQGRYLKFKKDGVGRVFGKSIARTKKKAKASKSGCGKQVVAPLGMLNKFFNVCVPRARRVSS